MLVTEQEIAQKENKLARLKKKKKKSTLANGQKTVVGGMIISLAKKDWKGLLRNLDSTTNCVTSVII